MSPPEGRGCKDERDDNFIDTEEIIGFAREIGGGEVPEKVLEALCAAASAQLLARLKKGVDRDSVRSEFVMAAGMLALSMYIAASGSGEVTAFKAGNLSVERAGGESAADNLRRQAELLLSGYLEDQGFAFQCIDSSGTRSCHRRGWECEKQTAAPRERGEMT